MANRNAYSLLYTFIIIFMMYMVFFGKFLITKAGISAPPLINYILMLMILVMMIKYISKYIRYIYVFLGVLILYIGFKTICFNMDFLPSIISYSNFLWCFFLCVLVYEPTKKGLIDSERIKRHFYLIFFVECVLGVTQYLVPSVYEYFHIASWSWNGTAIEEYVETNMSVAQVAPIVGTFFQASTFANIIAIFVIIGCCDLIYYPKCLVFKLAVVLSGFALCFLTGIRTPILMVFVVISFIIFKYKKQWLKYYIVGVVLVAVFFLDYALTDSTGSLARMQLGLLALFSGDMDLLSTQTIFYSFYMIPYFLSNPIFGISLGDKYVVGSYVMSDFSPTDVQFMYILCEIGIIGFFICIWPLIKVAKITKATGTFANVKPVLLICALLTILDDIFLSFEAKILLAICFCMFYGTIYNDVTPKKISKR